MINWIFKKLGYKKCIKCGSHYKEGKGKKPYCSDNCYYDRE